MRSAVRTATAIAASLALSVGGASAATAGSATIKDKRHDVVLNGKLSGNRTPAQKSFAYGLDVKSAKFSVGKKYASVRWNFTDLKPNTTLLASTGFAPRNARKGDSKGLFISLNPDSTKAWTDAPYIDYNFTCGDPDPAVVGPSAGQIPAGAPQITPTVKYGKGGYIYAQFPRQCLELGSGNVSLSARFGIRSTQKDLNANFDEAVSSKKVKASESTPYVKY